ncbi:MAG: aminomethyltransferase family protein [Sedimentisphaerales bacterium]|nr:aminomethyltransferase family protein [Sedimentisphaerales bacterium]
MPNKTPFHDLHLQRDAQMTEHAGWTIPDHFGDPQAEHLACRQHLAVSDLSHCYRVRVSGPYAAKTLDQLLTCDITALPVERQCAALLCSEAGSVIEKLRVQHQDKGFLLIGHPQNHQRVLNILQENAPPHGITITDETAKTAMVSLQGPQALELLREKLPFDLGQMNPDDVIIQSYFFMRFVISFNNDQPEPGADLILPAKAAGMAWEMLNKYGESYGAKIVGLQAQNSLRVESALPALDHEINESIDPFTAGLAHLIDLNKPDFLGAPALRDIQKQSPQQQLVGLQLPSTPQNNEPILADQNQIGHITSHCFSPTLNQHIALAYINTPAAQPGQTIQTQNSNLICTITPLPFVTPAKTNS